MNQLDGETIELLQERVRLQRELLSLSKQSGISFYRPHAKQDAFHRSTCKRRAMFMGNRGGKSTAACAETIAWAMGERVWYPEGDLARRSGIPSWPTKQLIITTDWDKVNEIWTNQRGDQPGKIWKMCPQGFVKPNGTRRNHSGAIDMIEFANGALLQFDTEESFKRNPQGSESSDFDRVAVDEPIVEEMWKANARGLIDRHGQGDFTLTPLRERWIYDYFYGDGSDLAPNAKTVEGRFAVRGSIFDNPNLTREAIAEFERDLSDDEKACRLQGIPLELSGLVYKEFRREIHVLKDENLNMLRAAGWRDWHLPSPKCVMNVRIDPHPQTPHAVLFTATTPDQLPIVCHEIWTPCDAESLADQINAYLREANCFVNTVKCDPAAWVPDSITRQACVAEAFATRGLHVSRASKDKTNGILRMRSVFKQPRGVRFVPTLRRTLWELARYCYDKENKPVDKDDHMMENMYRTFIDDVTWFDPDRALGEPISDMPITSADLSAM